MIEKSTSRIEEALTSRVHDYAKRGVSEITERIEALDQEWDVERTVEAGAAALALAGLALGAFRSRKWLVLPAVVLPVLLQHGVMRWAPPVPLLRSLGIRSRKEVERERYALKVLRGDFAHVEQGPRAEPILNSVTS